MKFLTIPEIAERYPSASVLLAHEELTTDPLHVTVVGGKDDPLARALFLSALKYPNEYKRVEWWDKREGKLPRADVTYPELKTAAAFICTGTRCSTPIKKPEEIVARVERLNRG